VTSLPLVKPPQNDRLAAIMNLEAELDVRHDSILHGMHGSLTSMAELAGGDEGAALIALRDQLLPDGQQSMLKSYRAEATQAAQLEEQLSPPLRARTDGIQIGEGASAKRLTVFLDEWTAIGKELGALEDEKGRIEAAAGDAVRTSLPDRRRPHGRPAGRRRGNRTTATVTLSGAPRFSVSLMSAHAIFCAAFVNTSSGGFGAVRYF